MSVHIESGKLLLMMCFPQSHTPCAGFRRSQKR